MEFQRVMFFLFNFLFNLRNSAAIIEEDFDLATISLAT
jgi:hypothetical protein